MEVRIELKDPDHPATNAAAEATARLLMNVHRKLQAEDVPLYAPGRKIDGPMPYSATLDKTSPIIY